MSEEESKPVFILRPDDPTIRKPDLLQDKDFMHRKEVRQRVRTNTLMELEKLNDLNIVREELRGEPNEGEPRILKDDKEQVDAKEIFKKISEKKKENPKESLFRLINAELEKYDGLRVEEIKNNLTANALLRARKVIIDAAREEGIWSESEKLLLEAEEADNWEILESNLIKTEGRGGELDRKATRAGEGEDRVPYYDFDGIVSEHMRVAWFQARLIYLEENGEGSSTEANVARKEIELFGWGLPPLFLREKAKNYLNSKRRVIRETESGKGEVVGAGLGEIEGPGESLTEAFNNLAEQLGAELRFRELEGMKNKPKEQRAFIEKQLDEIENSPVGWYQTGGQDVLRRVARLEASYNLMDEELAKEVRARLSVLDVAQSIKYASGMLESQAGGTIGYYVSEAEKRRHEINKNVIEYFLLADYKDSTEHVIGTKDNPVWGLGWKKETGDKKGEEYWVQEWMEDRSKLEWDRNNKGLEMGYSEGAALAWNLLEKINSDEYWKVLRELGFSLTTEDIFGREFDNRGEPNPNVERVEGKLVPNPQDGMSYKIRNFFQENPGGKDSGERREKVKEWVLQQLGGGIKIRKKNDEDQEGGLIEKLTKEGKNPQEIAERVKEAELLNERAIRYVKMAENMSVVTLRTSMWNTGINGGWLFVGDEAIGGNDHLGECIYFDNWRHDREMRDAGPFLSINQISGWGSDWLTWENNSKQSYTPHLSADPKYDYAPRALYTEYIGQRNDDEKSKSTFAGKDSLGVFARTYATRFFGIRKLMVKKDLKPEDFTVDSLNHVYAYYKSTTKSLAKDKFRNEIEIKKWLVKHAIATAISEDGKDSWWLGKGVSTNLEELGNNVSNLKLWDEEGGTSKSFITPREWQEAKDEINEMIRKGEKNKNATILRRIFTIESRMRARRR